MALKKLNLFSKYIFTGFNGVTVSHFGRQLLAREIELECIHRATPKASQNFNLINLQESEEVTPHDSSNFRVPNHLQRLQPKIRNNKDTKDLTRNQVPVCIITL